VTKILNEVRDPVHTFITFSNDEKRVINSLPLQRLRHIHQLALTSLVYPGATHKRFEHSLGVMEMASRVFLIVTRDDHLRDDIKDALPEVRSEDSRRYWNRVLRMAALCHDLGHLPFSHAAERDLLPEGWNHERLSGEVILGMDELWKNQEAGPLDPEHILKLALGPKDAPELEFSLWETVLSEIIVGDSFGADRIDYLLRDSHHVGVPYGRFDHYRLIDTLRLLIDAMGQPAIGIEHGGLHTAEALLLARYFMYTQVYLHPIRAIYDQHLIDFLTATLEGGKFSTDVDQHLKQTDNEVWAAILNAARDSDLPGHVAARAIVERKHFKILYSRTRPDAEILPKPERAVFLAAVEAFGPDHVRVKEGLDTNKLLDFPVRLEGGVRQAQALSDVLFRLPVVATGYVFVDPELEVEAKRWLDENREQVIIAPREA
jgi:HD superfamily phosphohydrolase